MSVRARPLPERDAPLRREHRAERERVRGRDEDTGDVVVRGERGHVDAVPVDGDRHGFEAGVGDELAVVAEARILDREAPRARGPAARGTRARAPA